MKQGKIYMKAWLDLHGRAKVLATDHWYLEFANLLLPVVSESYLSLIPQHFDLTLFISS